MNNDFWKKRYSFRLTDTDEDKELYNFIESANEDYSETIRKLLKLAIFQIEENKRRVKAKDDNEFYFLRLIQEIRLLNNQRFQNHLEVESGITEDLNNGPPDLEEEMMNKSIENSMASMIDMFDMDN